MKIAVTYEDGQVFQHFGHTPAFKVYDVEDGEIKAARVVNADGSGHGALAGVLKGLDVDVLLCGGIGGGAQTALAEAGIRLCGGVIGGADEAAKAFLTGELAYDPNARCDRHGQHRHGQHRHGGAYGGEHDCGGH